MGIWVNGSIFVIRVGDLELLHFEWALAVVFADMGPVIIRDL
jgi:hypothetical protein